MTEYIPLYWNGISKNQQLYEDLFQELVPHEGKAETELGEMLRIVSQLHYDIYNNGGCNFSNYIKERAWLVRKVPDYAKDTAREFTKSFKYGKQKTVKEMKMIDKFVDWTLFYILEMKKLDNLKEILK